MNRRHFLAGTVSQVVLPPARPSARDVVTLGPTRIAVSRLAIGTGTRGGRKGSNQTRQLGLDGLADLLSYGHENGITFWDAADSYGTHAHLRQALRSVSRDRVVIMTKSSARTAAQMTSDLDRFRQELGVDCLDIVLLHARTRTDWDQDSAGAMEVLAAAKTKGVVRAHGLSSHSIDALRTASGLPWVDIILARFNPIGVLMDSDPSSVQAVLKQAKANGKGVVGMKILAEGEMRNRVNDALRHALSQQVLDAFTIGVENRSELADLIKRIPEV